MLYAICYICDIACIWYVAYLHIGILHGTICHDMFQKSSGLDNTEMKLQEKVRLTCSTVQYCNVIV